MQLCDLFAHKNEYGFFWVTVLRYYNLAVLCHLIFCNEKACASSRNVFVFQEVDAISKESDLQLYMTTRWSIYQNSPDCRRPYILGSKCGVDCSLLADDCCNVHSNEN